MNLLLPSFDWRKYGYDTRETQKIVRSFVVKFEEFRQKGMGLYIYSCRLYTSIYRRILMAGMGFKDSDEQAPLYLRTTEEMLAEFDYLGSDLAYDCLLYTSRCV